jgi:uncharacterized protein affecting Mg2+/Co2+ transport
MERNDGSFFEVRIPAFKLEMKEEKKEVAE